MVRRLSCDSPGNSCWERVGVRGGVLARVGVRGGSWGEGWDHEALWYFATGILGVNDQSAAWGWVVVRWTSEIESKDENFINKDYDIPTEMVRINRLPGPGILLSLIYIVDNRCVQSGLVDKKEVIPMSVYHNCSFIAACTI